jgi:DnaJ-class molecular chaperone
VELNKRVLCDHCRGVGAERPEDVETCSLCGGRGVREVHQQMAPGFVMRQEVQYVRRTTDRDMHGQRGALNDAQREA